MARSLTVLLPVHNVESTLAATVLEILEVVSELTEWFELVIIDDGSADATSEVAHELTRRYPQVHAARHGKHLGREATIRTGLQQSSGEIIFLREEDCGLSVDVIPRLWRAAQRQDIVLDRSETPDGRKWTRFSAGHPTTHGGFQMVDRQTMEQIHGPSRPTRPNYLTELKKFALGE